MKKIFTLLLVAVIFCACDDEEYSTRIDADSTEMNFLNEGGERKLNIASNTAWNATVNQPWVKVSQQKGQNDQSLDITVEPNTGKSERTAIITVRSIFPSTFSKTITINQGNIGVSTNQLDFSYQTSIQDFIVNMEGEWSLENNDDWLILSTESGSGKAVIDVTVKPNNSSGSRSGNITLKSAGNNNMQIKVQQAKLPELVGLYILSEGTQGRNQAELAYYDFKETKILKKIYKERNGEILGDTGNDLAIYGGKMYCVVTGASVDAGGGHIEILDIETGISKKRIPFKGIEGGADMPRRITFFKDKAYITGYSGMVARLDTASLEIDAKTPVSGTYPEGITQYGGKLYVCNSGKGHDNSISVIDIASFKEDKKITVPQNPYNIHATFDGDIYFNTATLYWVNGELSNLHLLDIKTEKVVKTYDSFAGKLAVANGYLYTADMDYKTYDSFSTKVNLETKEATTFTTNFSSYYMAYSTNANPYNGDVYIGGQGQDVRIYGSDGTLKTEMKTGTGFTSTVVPVYR